MTTQLDREPGGFWNQPQGGYMDQAMEELGLTVDDLEDTGPVANIPVGDYPNLDRVFARAWKLQAADEETDKARRS